ncbi:hypothetical protein RB195_007864 [Necator americanus]|uniref:BPTI/Kunitz inhibitor domain-containing protein n=1 Tax=Necator americanus TaxID=51031 RepID=A0ABR1BZA6_NECAM
MKYLALFFLLILAVAIESKRNIRCDQKLDTGIKCRRLTPRYAYMPRLDKCIQFQYGGCGGNSNNFERMRDCEATCVGK